MESAIAEVKTLLDRLPENNKLQSKRTPSPAGEGRGEENIAQGRMLYFIPLTQPSPFGEGFDASR
jgi:hypothetical protein